MPNYDYFCKKNGKTVEVSHDVNTKLKLGEKFVLLVKSRSEIQMSQLLSDSLLIPPP